MNVATEEVRRSITRLLDASGVTVHGTAELSSVREQIDGGYREPLGDAIWGVSLGIGLPDPVVDRLPDRTVGSAMLYKRHAYDIINLRLDMIASAVAQTLQAAGFQALPVPASQMLDRRSLTSLFPHKTAAHLAGLGWIGKNCLLITPEVGPRIRWATVVTDAVLETTAEPLPSRCGTCDACVRICPAAAFTGRTFRPEEDRSIRFAAADCRAHLGHRQEETGYDVCGLCLFVCPVGRASGGGAMTKPSVS